MQIKYIKGIDLSPNEVEEARRRFQEMKVKRRRMNRGKKLTSHHIPISIVCSAQVCTSISAATSGSLRIACRTTQGICHTIAGCGQLVIQVIQT